MSQHDHPEKPVPVTEPEAAASPSEPDPPPPPRTPGRFGRFVRHHVTQLVAVGVVAAVLGAGVAALAAHEEGGDRVHQVHHRGDHEGDHEGDHGRDNDGDR